MKRLLQIYGFVVIATTLLLALLKLASFPGITWGWVVLPILGPFTLWLLFIGLVTTVGLIWPPKTWKSVDYPNLFPNRRGEVEEYHAQVLRVDRDVRYELNDNPTGYALKEAYYKKALALELATLAHDTPGFIQWEKRGETLVGELKILVKND
jgi:hypothetical protein